MKINNETKNKIWCEYFTLWAFYIPKFPSRLFPVMHRIVILQILSNISYDSERIRIMLSSSSQLPYDISMCHRHVICLLSQDLLYWDSALSLEPGHSTKMELQEEELGQVIIFSQPYCCKARAMAYYNLLYYYRIL